MNRAGLGLLLILAPALACVHTGVGRDPSAATSTESHCAVPLAALRETIKPYDNQPDGLEDACVRRRAAFQDRVYVDARFGRQWEKVPIRSCEVDGYVIRFDFDRYEPSPTGEVVLLLFESQEGETRQFSAAMEESTWPKKKTGKLALSACGSASASVQRSTAGWTARVLPPPSAPDEL
jgi:hypothetical protein